MPALRTPPSALSISTELALDEDGHLVPASHPTWLHGLAVSWLIHTLRNWLVPRGGFVLGSHTKLAISPLHGRRPDVLAYFARPLRGAAPDLVVEVVNATPVGHRDRIGEPADYATLGVHHSWLLDPTARTLEVSTLDSTGRFRLVLAAAAGTHDIPGCPGLRLDLDALWSELDRATTFFSTPTP